MKIPIINSILRASKNAKKTAFRETAFTVFFSTIPIWALPLLFGVFISENPFILVSNNISSGELYLFSTALIGPMICWILADYLIDPRNRSNADDEEDEEAYLERQNFFENINQKFPDALILIGILFLLALYSCFAVFILSTSDTENSFLEINTIALYWGGIIIFFISVFVLYSVLCFKHDLQNPTEIMRDKEHKFVDKFSNFKGSQNG